MMTLIQHLVQDVCFSEDLTRSNVLLLCSLVVLLNRISLIDRYFDTHKDACNYTFLYSIRTLKYLFEDHNEVNSTTKYILSELHSEFCEDDLPEDGSGEDEET
ncbi:hypothetical protein GBAR_LOCUS16771 [Geodia barretti]|uniref:Uncharacterized protein n=2 Tax=Geodia barretti TaxID=519541 RepID=A0AA35WPY4_GEOBA|nr:hypothetical protein GBAR_LOCUS16771 [Geodia barretti]